jgi:cation diffusion facilitator family transporter
MFPSHLRGPIVLSILAAIFTIGLKTTAYLLTGSVGLFSDALESGVNLLAAGTAYFSLWYAAHPVDATHTYGHEKIEYFSSGMEGLLILIAGLGTTWFAITRMLAPQPLESLGLGTAITLVATLINLVVAIVLMRAARKHASIVLEADGHHLMTDVLTSFGVVAGMGLVLATDVTLFDPLIAAIIGLNILWTGFTLVRKSFNGLMDHALPTAEQDALRAAIRELLPRGADFHALRTRQAGSRQFADFHLLVPGRKSVREAHTISHRIMDGLKTKLPRLEVTIHIEPIDDAASWEPEVLEPLGEPIHPEPKA